MTSEQARKDLHRLAVERVQKAVEDVAQLLDDHEQILHLMAHVAAATSIATAEFIHHNITLKGKPIPKDACAAKVLTLIADAMGMESKVVSPEDAKKIGLK